MLCRITEAFRTSLRKSRVDLTRQWQGKAEQPPRLTQPRDIHRRSNAQQQQRRRRRREGTITAILLMPHRQPYEMTATNSGSSFDNVGQVLFLTRLDQAPAFVATLRCDREKMVPTIRVTNDAYLLPASAAVLSAFHSWTALSAALNDSIPAGMPTYVATCSRRDLLGRCSSCFVQTWSRLLLPR